MIIKNDFILLIINLIKKKDYFNWEVFYMYQFTNKQKHFYECHIDNTKLNKKKDYLKYYRIKKIAPKINIYFS